MNGASHYLTKALEAGMAELNALRQGDVDKAVELSEQRNQYTEQALAAPKDVSPAELKQHVLRLHSLQETLTAEAQKLRENIRDTLNNAHKQQRRMTAYQRASLHAM